MVTPLLAKHISKAFDDEQVLTDLNLELREHETLSILGRSGCGKTTLLKILAGLEAPDAGTVKIHNTDIQSLAPHQRDVVYLYQEALLFPHLSLFENIAFGLRLRKRPEDEIVSRTTNMIEQLDLADMESKKPHQLSGGQKQRVSFGRALITNPTVLLLDEPFANLDADTRANMQNFFNRIAAKLKITAISVTHNVKEAILMGDRIATLVAGKLAIYPSVEKFIASGNNGIQEEIDFWESLTKHHKAN